MFTDKARSALADAVAGVELDTPARIRRRGAARTRHQALAGVVAALVMVTGAGFALARAPWGGPDHTVTASPPVPGSSAPTAPGRSPAAPSSPPPGSPSQPTITTIADQVLLRSGDLGGAEVNDADLGYWRNGGRIPPRPCTGTGYASDARRTAQRAVQATVGPGQSQYPGPHVVVEYVAVYDADGARGFMTELRTAVNRCPGKGTRQSPAWAAVGTVDGGDDSLLIRYTLVGGYDGDPGTRTDQYLAVVRIGRVILVLASVGWETNSGYAAVARALAPVAANRLRPLA